MEKIEFRESWNLEKVCDWEVRGKGEVIIFSTKSIRELSMAKMYETKRIIVARFLVRNIGDKVKKIFRGMKSIMILSTTRRTIASRPKNTKHSLKYKQNHLEKALTLYKR